MRRLLWFALVAVAAWYGWTHWEGLRRTPGDQIVVANRSGAAIERLRIGVGDDVAVFESVENGTDQRRAWRGRSRGWFTVRWSQRGRVGEREWRGAEFEPTGTPFTHSFEFQPDGRVLARSDRSAQAR